MQDVEALNETIERLEEDLQKEKLRSDDAQCTLQVLQEQLDLAHAGAPTSACTEQNKDVPSDNTSSALWQELDVARNEAASAKASAAEARANAESAVVQLEQLGSTHRGLLNDIRDLLCGPGAPQPDSSCQGIIAQLERCMQQRSSLEQQLSETRKRLVEEQESAVEVSLYPLHVSFGTLFAIFLGPEGRATCRCKGRSTGNAGLRKLRKCLLMLRSNSWSIGSLESAAKMCHVTQQSHQLSL